METKNFVTYNFEEIHENSPIQKHTPVHLRIGSKT